MTNAQIKHMIDRFLGWRLPKPWNPDNGISYQRPNYAHPPADHDWPTGTNLFDATQAEVMVRYMAEGLPDTGSGYPIFRLKERLDLRLNNHLCEMKEGYDDSVVGFNEAWDIVRAAFAEASPMTSRQDIERAAREIVREVAELPDRDSPASNSDHMLVTANELVLICEHAIERLTSGSSDGR